MAFSFTKTGFSGFNGDDPSIGKKIQMNVLSIKSLFRKYDEDGKRIKHEGYPFLNSRYSTTDPRMKNPMAGGYTGPRTQSKDEKFEIEKNIRTYYGGNDRMRQLAEKQAKSSYQTYRMLNQNLYRASKLFDKNPYEANTLFKQSIDKAYKMHFENSYDRNISIANSKMIKKFASGFLAPQVAPLFRSYR